jgi:predicted metal-dependent peptidase
MKTEPFVLVEVVRRPRSQMRAPAYTDGLKIYIANNLSKREERLAIIHEQAHIMLNHFNRGKRVLAKEIKEFDKDKWEISLELEIARHLYSDTDEALIKSKRSGLYGGVVRDSIPELPSEIVIAEDIYEWLKQNKSDQPESATCLCSHDDKDSNEDDKSNQFDKVYTSDEVKNIIEVIRQFIDAKNKQETLLKDNAQMFENIKKRKPTLISEIDKSLRTRAESHKSYRRPSRYPDTDFILKGRMTRHLSPLVEIFLDRSGSFTPEKTRKANDVVQKVLQKYGSSIRKDVWFFGSDKISSEDFEGGNTPYHLIIEHLNKTVPKIAIVITDDDSAHGGNPLANPLTKILCIPIDCVETDFNKLKIGMDVTL